MEVEVAGLNPKQCHTQVYLNGTRLNSVTDLVSPNNIIQKRKQMEPDLIFILIDLSFKPQLFYFCL